MALTFPEPQRPRKTWDLHVIVQCLLEQSGEGFFFIFFSPEWEAGAAESASLNIPPPRLLPGDTQGERLLPGLRAVTINVCSFMGLIGF